MQSLALVHDTPDRSASVAPFAIDQREPFQILTDVPTAMQNDTLVHDTPNRL